jgi:hypothetical protein
MTYLLFSSLLACGPKVAPVASPSEATLPTGIALVDASIEAIGGAAALAAIENAILTYAVLIPAQGIEGRIVVRYLAPNQMEIHQNFPSLSDGTHGTDGTRGWATDNMMGPRLMEGVELQTSLRDASLTWMSDFETFYPEPGVVTRIEEDGQPMWMLEVTSTWGTPDSFAFDATTGLMFNMATRAETPMGPIPVTMVFRDYQEMSGLLLAVEQSIFMASIEMKKTLLSFEINLENFAPITMPDDVKALLESMEAAEAAGAAEGD